MPEAPEYRCHVAENTEVGSIIATVTGTDADVSGRQLHHEIIAGDPHGFLIINSATGTSLNLFWSSMISVSDKLRNPVLQFHDYFK